MNLPATVGKDKARVTMREPCQADRSLILLSASSLVDSLYSTLAEELPVRQAPRTQDRSADLLPYSMQAASLTPTY